MIASPVILPLSNPAIPEGNDSELACTSISMSIQGKLNKV